MSALRRTLRGAGALVVLALIIAGLPVLLYRLGGWPIPSRLPSFRHVEFVLAHRDNGSLFLGAVRDVSWLAWAAFAVSALAEAQAALRGRRAPRLHLPGLQDAASRLIAAVALMFSAPAATVLAAAPALAASAQPAAPRLPHGAAETDRVVVMERTVTVRPGDCLWTIAQRYLGSGDRFSEIARLNLGRDMGDGRVFRDPALILPGWRLQLPGGGGATRPPEPADRDVDQPGHHHAAHPSADPQFARRHEPASGPAEPAPAPTTSWVSARTDAARTPVAAAGQHDPRRALGLFALGMLAGGALASLERLRHEQRQRRRPGRRIPLPEDNDGWRVERKLRAAAGLGGAAARLGGAAARLAQSWPGGRERDFDDDWPPRDDFDGDDDLADGTDRPERSRSRRAVSPGLASEPDLPATLGEALRALGAGVAASGHPLPPIVGVHLTSDNLDVLLSAPAAGPPPPPFTIAPARQAMCWTVELAGTPPHRDAPQPEPGEVGDLLPGLFTAGATDGGGFLLLDLEAMRVTCCDGPDDLADRLLVTAATELASSQWSGWYDLILVGCDELEILGRAGRCDDLDEALPLLEARARLVEARLRDGGPAEVITRRLAEPEDEDWGLTLLVSRDQPTPEQMSRLLEVTDGPGGIAALVAGDTQTDAGKVAPALFALEPDPDRPSDMVATVHLAHLGPDRQITVWPRTLTVAEYQALAGVFAVAAKTGDLDPDAHPYADYGSPPWLRLAAAPVAVAEPGEFIRPVARPEPGESVVQSAANGSAARHAGDDLAARAATWRHAGRAPLPSGSGVQVRVLGPVEVTGPADPLQPKQAELVLALALHAPVGLSSSALCDLLGPDEDHPRPADAVRQLITRARRKLGQASDGREYIVHEGGGIYVLHEGVSLDWTGFMSLASRGRASRDRRDLREALAMVRGQPFADCFHWWIDTGLVETIRAEIVDAAELLAGLELDAGDPRAAARAAGAGLAAEPAAEQLWRALMRAEHEAGNLPGVTSAWHGCLDAIAEIAPGADPHPDTERLYRRLSHHFASA